MKKGRVERESGVCVGEVRAGWGEILKTCVSKGFFCWGQC